MLTAVPERGGRRLLTDPTFDPAGEAYPTTAYTLRKTKAPANPPETMGLVDAVFLGHELHFDKLVHLGRALLLQILFTGGDHPAPRPSPLCACERLEAEGVLSPDPDYTRTRSRIVAGMTKSQCQMSNFGGAVAGSRWVPHHRWSLGICHWSFIRRIHASVREFSRQT